MLVPVVRSASASPLRNRLLILHRAATDRHPRLVCCSAHSGRATSPLVQKCAAAGVPSHKSPIVDLH